MNRNTTEFMTQLKKFAKTLTTYVSTNSGDWSIKGFIDVDENVYTISSDSKIISKILEIQLFPKFKQFAAENGYEIILAEKQNWYPDISFVSKTDPTTKFAVDIALKRNKHITSVDKANVLECSQLWRQTVDRIMQGHSNICLLYTSDAADE